MRQKAHPVVELLLQRAPLPDRLLDEEAEGELRARALLDQQLRVGEAPAVEQLVLRHAQRVADLGVPASKPPPGSSRSSCGK